MSKLLLIALCVVSSLFAQSGITFSISKAKPTTEPGWSVRGATDYLLTVKKSDPRAVDMFWFEVVDGKGKAQSTYIRIDENRIAPVIPADATEWTTHPFLGYTSAEVLSVRNVKVVFAGEDNPIVKKRDAALIAGRTFHVGEALGPQEQDK
jgi:hypothetical protein